MQPRPAWGWQQWLKLHTGQTSGTWEPSVSGASASSGVHQALSERGTSLALFQPLQASPETLVTPAPPSSSSIPAKALVPQELGQAWQRNAASWLRERARGPAGLALPTQACHLPQAGEGVLQAATLLGAGPAAPERLLHLGLVHVQQGI